MKLVSAWKWMRRTLMFLVMVAVLSGGLLGYMLDRTERAILTANTLIQRGDFVSAEDMLVREDNFFLTKFKNRFSSLRDGRLKLARCRTEFGLARYDTAAESCLNAAGEARTSDEKFFAYYYAALAKFNRGSAVGASAGAATDAIYYLKEALKVREDGEAQALLSALLEEEKNFKEMLKGLKGKAASKEKPRMPSLFRDDGGAGAGAKEKGY